MATQKESTSDQIGQSITRQVLQILEKVTTHLQTEGEGQLQITGVAKQETEGE